MSSRLLAAAVVVLVALACSKADKKVEFPETPPDQVALRFFDLLSKGGKLTTMEAQSMVSTAYMEYDPDDFRRWTSSYSADSRIKVLETILPEKPNERGEWVASVMLEVKTPSSFGDYFTTHSRMNLILDQEANEWKIDFMGDTIDESHFREAPAEARPPGEK